jgi:microcystin-dependent protein
MAAACTTAAGDGVPHENMAPFQAVSFIIALQGVYPPQS